MENQYKWLDIHFIPFLKKLNIPNAERYRGMIDAHGDKAYGYKGLWEQNGIPFNHGIALYMLANIPPYNRESRDTQYGWVAPSDWVIAAYPRFKGYLPKA